MPDSTKHRIAEGVPLALLYKREIKLSPELVMLSEPRSVAAERFRRLRVRIANQFADARVIVVTSGIPGEGKSTVAFNLALAFAGESAERTLLIDGDLRRPSIGRHLNPPPRLGLTEVLLGQAEPVHAVLNIKDSSLDILPAGETHPPDPLELLGSETMRALVDRFKQDYKHLIIDSPPIIPFTDADALGRLSDGILLVTRSGVTPKAVYTQAIASVTSTRILGTVLNGATRSPFGGTSSYDAYYRDYYDKERTRA